ncbi:hemoglobin larval subunit beta-1-like [Ambystoma mexicanum]|uniref:hemoglobin larval subunit beta-1-like n=1 Tax=Ambystoma mexicanum TaxID=8296 RepID=UPI0037E793AF
MCIRLIEEVRNHQVEGRRGLAREIRVSSLTQQEQHWVGPGRGPYKSPGLWQLSSRSSFQQQNLTQQTTAPPDPKAKMVHWTAEEKAAVASVWSQVDVETDGQETLARVLVVYPWTKRYFSSFGDLSSVAAISGNSKVRDHGKKVLAALADAAHPLEDIKNRLSQLGELHADTLHVDPQNFQLLGNCLVIVLARKLGAAFTPEVHAAWEKFLAVACAALSKHYH